MCHWASSPSVSKTRRLDPDNKGTTVLQNTVTSLMTPSYLRRLEYSVKTFIGCCPQQTPDKPSTQLMHTLKHSYACCKEGHSVTIQLQWVRGWSCSLRCNVKVWGAARNSLCIKQLGCDAEYSPPSTWRSVIPIFHFPIALMVWWIIKHWDNFTSIAHFTLCSFPSTQIQL